MSLEENRLYVGNNDTANFINNELIFYKDVKEIPIPPYPSYIEYGMVILCTEGNARIKVHTYEHLLAKNELIILLPGQLISLNEISKDFSISAFSISRSLFNDVLSGICRFSPHFFFYMRSHFYYELTDSESMNFGNYYNMVCTKAQSPSNLYPRESVIHILRILYLDLYNSYKIDSLPYIPTMDSHKKELTDKFFSLIMQHYKENREVSFYAKMLCITPKYLTTIVKAVSGKSAKDWILEYIILEIKALLRDSSLNIQEIVLKTNFANQSSLARFFRKHTGMSPSEFRKGKLDTNL
ncbi:helix-turn-helix domain-containing protein [Parabacteroides goldsteinii]|uniref:helix-turn-helix domain-containing protein n=1 Tax=Parabacteroides goldsteinii TaxID=328812 RepID=UPI0025A00A1D|nr:helix-turn-helix domain-containing protein [Parabacteroides goldsteinii]